LSGPLHIRSINDIAAIEREGLDAFLAARTPFDTIRRSAERWPEQVALRYIRKVGDGSQDEVITYSELLRRIVQAANLFRRLGVEAGDAVAILAPHVPSSQIALWAAQLAGRACPINPLLRPDHVVSLIRASGANVAIVLGDNRDLRVWDAIIPALRKSRLLKAILHTDEDSPTADSDGYLEQLLTSESDRLGFDPVDDPDAIAAFFHTGGTTGSPKLAIHTRRNQAFVATAAARMYDLGPDDTLINGFPLFHVAGAFVYGLSVLTSGGSLLIPTRLGMRNRRFIETIWKNVETYRVTAIGGVPTVISALNQVPVDADISSLRVMLTGGSPLPTELADAFERGVGKPVRNILGMTECAGVVTIEPFHGPRTPGSTGLRLPFTEVAAFKSLSGDIDLSERCRVGETGILALRGPNVGPGYSDPARNAGTFEPNGWLISGDLGYLDAEDRVFVTGRAKDVIIRGAHNIDPAIIEDALLQHPSVSIAAAVGQPDAYAGELPVAFVVLKPGAQATGDDLRAFVGPLVAEPAIHPRHVAILQDMPLTPIGKIYKPALRVLATRRGIAEAFAGIGIDESSYRLEVGERGATIYIANPAIRETARKSLEGMPVHYEFVAVPP
jgi:fatty-acyl-CoA synthase